jgi:HEAT repeat protein
VASEHFITTLEADNYSDLWHAVAVALRRMNLRAVWALEPLLSALRDDRPRVRRRAAWVLGQLKDVRAVDSLIVMLNDDVVDVRREATQALKQIGDIAVESFVATLAEENHSDLWRGVALALKERKLKEVWTLEALIRTLRDDRTRVRRRTAWVLGELNDALAVKPLVFALEDNDSTVRQEVIRALRRIGTPQALVAVREYQKQPE